jgi:hypothetical protein
MDQGDTIEDAFRASRSDTPGLADVEEPNGGKEAAQPPEVVDVRRVNGVAALCRGRHDDGVDGRCTFHGRDGLACEASGPRSIVQTAGARGRASAPKPTAIVAPTPTSPSSADNRFPGGLAGRRSPARTCGSGTSSSVPQMSTSSRDEYPAEVGHGVSANPETVTRSFPSRASPASPPHGSTASRPFTATSIDVSRPSHHLTRSDAVRGSLA